MDRSDDAGRPADRPTDSFDPGDESSTRLYIPGLDTPDPDATPPLEAVPADAPPDPPDLGGRYRNIRFHARGGLGVVWQANDAVLDREVAVKTIRRERAFGPATIDRFVQEGRATARLEHPSIVPVYDLAADPEPHYVMRFVAGRTLSAAIKAYHTGRAAGTAGPLELNALLDALVTVGRAVEFAHARDELHRDLKGQNVILGRYGEVFLIDWGLSKSSAPAANAAPTSAVTTRPGAVVGTPAYMAPEQAEGKPATAASDVYGLGAILYAILTGRAPYTGSTADEVLSQVRAAPPAAVRAVRPDAPPPLVAICERAMAREPAGRYGSAAEVATEVRRWLAGEPVTAYPEPLLVRAGRWARRHRTAVTAAAAVLVAVTVASIVGAVLLARARQQTATERDAANTARQAAEDSLNLALTLVAVRTEAATRGETGGDGPASDAERRLLLDRTVEAGERLLQGRPNDADLRERTARVQWYAANLARFLGDLQPADRAYEASAGHYRRLTEQSPGDPARREQLARVLRDRAGLLWLAGRLKEAVAAADEAVGLIDRPGGDRFELAMVLLVRYEAEMNLGRPADAERTADRAGELLDGLQVAVPHPYTRLFRAEARSLAAAARREADPSPAGLAAALAGHDAAVEEFRDITRADGRRDFALHLGMALRQRAETGGRVPDRRPQAAADLNESVGVLDRLAREYPDAPFYREEVARALIARGNLRAATATDAGGRLLAEADYLRALGLANRLVGGLRIRENDRPGYRALQGEAYAALAGLVGRRTTAGDRWAAVAQLAEVNVYAGRAVGAFRRADKLEPDNPAHPRRGGEVARNWAALAARVEEWLRANP